MKVRRQANGAGDSGQADEAILADSQVCTGDCGPDELSTKYLDGLPTAAKCSACGLWLRSEVWQEKWRQQNGGESA